MDIKALNQALLSIAQKKNELIKIDYNDDAYDNVEEELHDLEDDFQEKYGDYLEDVLQDVHDELCPDNDVLLPIAYLAKEYIISPGDNNEKVYDVKASEGVLVEVDDYPGQPTRLVLLPNPLRILLQINQEQRQEVWAAQVD
ncbi:MAG: hypothetical protein ACR2MX_01745 [Cyclobacteriaceae bacterium]